MNTPRVAEKISDLKPGMTVQVAKAGWNNEDITGTVISVGSGEVRVSYPGVPNPERGRGLYFDASRIGVRDRQWTILHDPSTPEPKVGDEVTATKTIKGKVIGIGGPRLMIEDASGRVEYGFINTPSWEVKVTSRAPRWFDGDVAYCGDNYRTPNTEPSAIENLRYRIKGRWVGYNGVDHAADDESYELVYRPGQAIDRLVKKS